jgi:serine/threonine protein kinase
MDHYRIFPIQDCRYLETLADSGRGSQTGRRSGHYARRRIGGLLCGFDNLIFAASLRGHLSFLNPYPAQAADNARPFPEKIGKYVIINEIGQGSTGSVYLSHDPYFRRDVAIKVYNIESDEDPQRAKIARKMFFNEAHMVGMLQHPNILPIYDAGEENDQYYVVMEHIQEDYL